MKLLKRTMIVSVLGVGLISNSAALLSAAGQNGYQDYRDSPRSYDVRGLVDRTQNDLRAAADLEHPKKDQRQRYNDAQGHLSTFDRKLSRGKFDKGELNKSISKIKQILNKNVLQASTRDALTRDLGDLQTAHDRYR